MPPWPPKPSWPGLSNSGRDKSRAPAFLPIPLPIPLPAPNVRAGRAAREHPDRKAPAACRGFQREKRVQNPENVASTFEPSSRMPLEADHCRNALATISMSGVGAEQLAATMPAHFE